MRKRIISMMLVICMVLMYVPTTAYATGNGTGTAPSVSAYATKAQLKNAFTPGEDGTATNYGKLVFGKNSSGEAQQWYILGKDTGVDGDNTVIFAASPIVTNQKFDSSTSDKRYNYEAGTGYGDTDGNIEVYQNHYGASDLRMALNNMVDSLNTTYFTTAEKGLMNATTVTTKDTKKSATYTTTDKLYALAAENYDVQIIKAGTYDQIVLAMSKYWSRSEDGLFWLRSPEAGCTYAVLLTRSGSHVQWDYVGPTYPENAVQPASNLNLSSVLFASSAQAASSDTAEVGTIDKDANGEPKAMTLRLDGSSKNIGAAIYNAEEGTIEVRKGSTSENVVLVVQGNDGTSDWYYSKKIDASETINASNIKLALSMSTNIDLSACKIWLETTDTDGMIYAVNADKEIKKINTTYVTKEQLMNSFSTYSDGTATNIGKLVFGKNSSGDAQQWYIIGKDTGMDEDNTVIFAANPIATGQVFEDNSSNNKTFESDFGVYETNPSEVYPNHYGASDLRVKLKGMETSNFTQAEQDMMNATKVTTEDKKNSKTYTTTDKLYVLAADGSGSSYKTIKAGTYDQIVLAMSNYWSRSRDVFFWLRLPADGGSYMVMSANPGQYVSNMSTNGVNDVQPASNLKLSSVLFASAATAASSGTATSGTIGNDTNEEPKAMTLRLDGSSKNIGAVEYSATTGEIKATKGSATGNVALVVQGNDGTNDWYYSKQVTDTETVKAYTIKSALNLSTDIDLSACKIWIETTEDNVAYAVKATEATIIEISTVEITGIDTPRANTALDTEAACATPGVNSDTPPVIWTPAAITAGYNTSYTASVTLSADAFYYFTDSTAATVNDNAATSVKKNEDGTLTVTKEFTTGKRKIVSVVAPTVPIDNTFTNYYGYGENSANPIDSSRSELGTQATVTFEGTMAPTTENMNVTWTIESDGGYDKIPGETNTFRWTIPAAALTDYDASACQGYDADKDTITGTVTVKNKAATPVTITGTDRSIEYAGTTIDVLQYFDIDSNAGTKNYTLVTGTDGGTGEGTLSDNILTVTKTGTFKIKVSTAANGIYAAGEGNITLTVANGTIEYSATDYSGTYDGQAHSISVNVTNPSGTTVTYSTDGTNYGSDNPSFTEAGTHIVYYRITKNNYDTINGSKTVTINKKSVTITAQNQDIVWSNDIDQSNYNVSEGGLITGDSIREITLTPSTTLCTDNGTISISGVKIVNASRVDVTGNYDITPVKGILKIAHDTTLAHERIEAVKTKKSYIVGDTLKVDDITVRAYYADGYSEEVTGFTTNAAEIDMSEIGNKTLTVSYTKDNKTSTDDIIIVVSTAYKPTGGSSSSETNKPTEDVTIPVENGSTVDIKAEIKDGTANVSEITSETINKIVDNVGNKEENKEDNKDDNKDENKDENKEETKVDTFKIDLSGAKQEVTAVTLSKKTVETLATTTASKDNSIDTVTIELSKASVVLDSKTLETVAKEAAGNDIKLVINDKEQSKLNNSQQNAIKDYHVATSFEAYFESNGKEIHDFNGGTATVTINFEPEEGKNMDYYHMVHISDDGVMTRYKTRYTKGKLSFTTPHFSDYAVIYDENEKNQTAIERPIPVTGLEVIVDKTTLTKKGATATIKATVKPADATNKNVTYTSSNTKVAKVDKNGKVTAIANGKTTVTVKTVDGSFTKKIVITVKIPDPMPTKAQIAANGVALNSNATAKWTKENYLKLTWGKVTGAAGYEVYVRKCDGKSLWTKAAYTAKKGNVLNVTLKKLGGKKFSGTANYKYGVRVYKYVNGKKVYMGTSLTYHFVGSKNKKETNAKSVIAGKKTITLRVKKTTKLTSKIAKVNTRRKLVKHDTLVRYISSNPNVAKVDLRTGKVTGVKAGKCKIYCIALNGVKATVSVTVK